MNGEELINLANFLVGDNEDPFDDTSATDLIYLNQVREEVEAEEEWEFLKTQDRSLTTVAGYNWEDGYDLSALDYLLPTAQYPVLVDVIPYTAVPLAKRVLYKDTGLRFCIDYSEDKLYLLDAPDSGLVITLNFVKKTDDITKTTEPSWPKFHGRIAYKMAIAHLKSFDHDDVNTAKAGDLEKTEEKLMNSMIDMNSKMALANQDMSMTSDQDEIYVDSRVDVNQYRN